MRTDITRNTFDPAKNFSRVLMQQGRVQLDADWNEQASILLHYLRALAADLIGPGGGPREACGFEPITTQAQLDAISTILKLDSKEAKWLKDLLLKDKLLLGPGRYYVEGVLVENHKVISFFEQPYFGLQDKASAEPANDSWPRVLYLDVWERHRTAFEDDSIREKALGGPETATRAQVVWHLRTRELRQDEKAAIANESPCAELKTRFEIWKLEERAHRGLLRARVQPEEASDDPCAASPESAFRGLENQLYRVEIHDSSEPSKDNQGATFKWSRDNGSVVASWLEQDGDVLTVHGVHDRARGFASGQWIEVNDEGREMRGQPGILAQVDKVDCDKLTITQSDPPINRNEFSNTAVARRWDQRETEELSLQKGVIALVEGQWLTLEDGVQIRFEPPADLKKPNRYRTGDYWLIPARVATKDIEWPKEENSENRAAVPPHGVQHYYAPLGILKDKEFNGIVDCRCQFGSLCKLMDEAFDASTPKP
jgi:uncharacterized protein DUF6519